MTCIDPCLVLELGEGLNGGNYGISITLGEAFRGVGGREGSLQALLTPSPCSEGSRRPGLSWMSAHRWERSHVPTPGRLSAQTANGGEAGP